MVNAIELKLRGYPTYIKVVVVLLLVVIVGALIFFVLNTLFLSDESEENNRDTFTISSELRQSIEDLNFNVSQPEKIPQGYSRVFVGVISENSSASGCVEVVQLYTGQESVIEISSDPNELPSMLESQEAFTEIDLYTYPLECGFEIPKDSETYSVGDHPGWISDSDPSKTTLIEIAVNQALVRVETSLSREEIEPVIESFVPFSDIPPTDSVIISNS